MILIEDFIWILLENDIWWPGILIKQRNQYLNIRSSSNNNNNHIVKLFGTEELISIDLSLLKNKNERIIFYSTNKNINFFNLYNQQNNIPDELKEYFKEAISLLNKYCLECHQQEKQGEEKQGEEKEKSIEVITTQIENQSQNEIQTNQIDSSISSNSSHSNSNSNQLSLKREDALSWDDYFIAVAFLSAMRSKDPSTQVGACIVNKKFRIVGIGYNGFPRGCSDDILPWARVADNELDTKYPYVCHAEVNAILNKNVADLEECTLYVALFPCNECAKIIIQSGIKRVIYLSDKYHHTNSMKASRRMFELAGIEFIQYKPTKSSILIDFLSIDLR